jgi:hypothetical protein
MVTWSTIMHENDIFYDYVSEWWKFELFFFHQFLQWFKSYEDFFGPLQLYASQSLVNAFFVLVSFCHFWKFYEVLCFVVHLHWSDMNVHSLFLTCTISLILSFSLPFCWWQFEIVWFFNNVYQMLICFKQMHIYRWNSLCFCWSLYNALCIFLLNVLLSLCAIVCAHSLHSYFESEKNRGRKNVVWVQWWNKT